MKKSTDISPIRLFRFLSLTLFLCVCFHGTAHAVFVDRDPLTPALGCMAGQYKITYDVDTNVTGTINYQCVTANASFTTNDASGITKSNATFLNWTDENGRVRLPGATYTYTYGQDITLTANWTCNTGYTLNAKTDTCTANAYTVTYYVGSGGSGTAQTQSVTYNASFTTKTPAELGFSKENATFTGWNSSQYPKAGTSYTYTTTGNTSLNATWQCNSGYAEVYIGGGNTECQLYTIKYHANASGATGTMNDDTVQCVYSASEGYDCGWKPQSNQFTNGNKKFLGWDESNSRTFLAVENGRLAFSSKPDTDGVIDLYARWGDCTACSPSGGASCALSAKYGVCTYTTFCPDDGYTITNNGKYNPSCTPNTYTITYRANDDYSSVFSESVHTYMGTFTTWGASDIPDAKANATFAGWLGSDGKTYTGNTTYTFDTPDDLLMTAQWNCNAGYTLNTSTGACVKCAAGTYKSGVGNGACNQCPSPYTNSDAGTTTANRCYKNCTMTGASSATGRDYQNATDTCEATACNYGYHLNAKKCELNNYSIVFLDGDNTSTVGTTQYIKFGQTFTAPAAGASKTGHTFRGWRIWHTADGKPVVPQN